MLNFFREKTIYKSNILKNADHNSNICGLQRIKLENKNNTSDYTYATL